MYSSLEESGLLKILTFLQTHNTEYLSGQDLSDVLKISRVAVWKQIKKIQELGYNVESKQKMGYKLVSNSDLPLPWEITASLKTKKIGRRVFYFENTDSTQNEAKKIAHEPLNDGAVIVTTKQTDGKGRSGRKWILPKGGIGFSVILKPDFDIAMTTLFPIGVSVALSNAIEKLFVIKPELKWPNDITIKSKKVAGILVDAAFESNSIEHLILGIGINFDTDIKKIEKQLGQTPNFYGITSLSQHSKKKVRQVELIQTFLFELEKIYELFNKDRTQKIISDWTERSSTIGKNVEMNSTKEEIAGKAIKIDEDGGLIVSKGNGKTSKIVAGDIIHS